MKHFLLGIILAPFLLLGQKNTKWITYKNSKQNYSISLPSGTQIDSTEESIRFILPENKTQKFRNEVLTLTIQNPIASCTDTAKSLLQNCGCSIQFVKKIKLNDNFFMVSKSESDDAMGGHRGIDTYYSTSRTSDKSCFIFNSYFNYFARWDEKKQGFIERDDNYRATEIKYLEKIIGSLKFTK